jgi:hypothetical protein
MKSKSETVSDTERDNAMEDEIEILDIGATLERLLAAQVHQKRYSESLAAKIAEQDATIAAQDAKIQLLTTLVDSHQHVIDVAKASAMQRGRVQ